MMKVLYICNFESPYRIDFWNELTKYCDVTVLFTETKKQQVGRNSKWFSNQKYLFHYDLLKQTPLPAGKHVCLGVVDYLKDRSYDLVIFHPYSPLSCMYGISYCIKNNIPYIINSDGGFAKSGIGLQERIKKYLISHAFAFTSTAELTDDYLAFYGGNRDMMYRYTLTTVRENEVLTHVVADDERRRLRKKHEITEQKVVITVGNMIPRKGFDLLLRADLAIDKEIGIYIVGGQPTEEYLEYCQKNKLTNIHFINFMDKEELREYYKAANLFVLPTREDIWGLVIVEAMACGLPVITTDRCIAGRELITQGLNGYIYSVNDIGRLSELVNKVFDEDFDISQMNENVIKRTRDITIEAMAKRHYEIFVDIMDKMNEKN